MPKAPPRTKPPREPPTRAPCVSPLRPSCARAPSPYSGVGWRSRVSGSSWRPSELASSLSSELGGVPRLRRELADSLSSELAGGPGLRRGASELEMSSAGKRLHLLDAVDKLLLGHVARAVLVEEQHCHLDVLVVERRVHRDHGRFHLRSRHLAVSALVKHREDGGGHLHVGELLVGVLRHRLRKLLEIDLAVPRRVHLRVHVV
mmetsp:Transcript_23658/g.62527  ORF Transcript_23658/g.62527 Transcript_23658/m.62527 type:complete len:204 (-) Transcript_23658:452-1063(-)